MSQDVMVDLETFSSKSNAMIVAIGAVELSPSGLGREFYCAVDATRSVGDIDPGTVRWWLQQNEAARRAISTGGTSLAEALQSFSSWFPADGLVWGNGATFDNVVLSNAYAALGFKRPWSYRDDRCYRTLKNLHADVPPVAVGTAHNALDDAKSQAMHMVQILNKR